MTSRRRRLALRRKAMGFTQEGLAERLNVERSTVVRWERGETLPQPWLRPKLARALQVSIDQLDGFLTASDEPGAELVTGRAGQGSGPAVSSGAVEQRQGAELRDVETLRQGLNEALSSGTMADASLDDWERTVVRYGKATRDRPASALIDDLGADLGELKRALERYRSASALRRLTRVAANMAGLMCLTLIKLDDRPAFARWARTARIAASESGDPTTHSWVLAQEAYGHYYSADYTEAITVARHAQDLVQVPCVGAALAAALEARAHAATGRPKEAQGALARAEHVLSGLDRDSVIPSAFGYTEAQLRFHEGNAYTLLGDLRPAHAAQERALDLCSPGDYTDWALTRLDRTACIAARGDHDHAITYLIDTMGHLTEPQRRGIIATRGRDLLYALPEQDRSLPAVRELRDRLQLEPTRKEDSES